MKRIVALFAMLAASLTFGARSEATHDGDCLGGIIDLRPSIDQFMIPCEGYGKGWMQTSYHCYYVTWVVEDGVVVDVVKHFKAFYGEPVFKPWYVYRVELYGKCTAYRPFLATRPGLAPSVIYWHG